MVASLASAEAPTVQKPQVLEHFCFIIALYLGNLQYRFNEGHFFGVPSLHSAADVPGAADAAGAALATGSAESLLLLMQILQVFGQDLVSFALYRGALQYFAYFPQPAILSLAAI